MKKYLLSLLLLIATTMAGWADSYTITFNDSGKAQDGSTALTASNFVSSAIATGADYITSCTATSKCYLGKTGQGLKVGAKNLTAGSFTLALSDAGKVNATSIVVNAARYNSSTAVTIAVNGSATQTPASTTFEDLAYTLDGSELSTISIATSVYSYVKSITVNYSSAPAAAVATPVFSFTTEDFVYNPTTTKITCATTGAKIYYTTDNSEPTDQSTEYVDGTDIDINTTMTLKAIAINGTDKSAIATADYIMAVATPVFSFTTEDVIYNPTTTKITCATTAAKIYYTTDNSEPTDQSTEYVDGTDIDINTTMTLKAIAINGTDKSAIATADYIMAVATPAFSVAEGTYSEAQNVELTSETLGASIYYTTDGKTPTAESTLYVAGTPIAISETTTVNAIAIKDGESSDVATATYTIISGTLYDFTQIDGFDKWGSSYSAHSVAYDDATVDFTAANRSTANVTDCPVTKGSQVVATVTNTGKAMKAVQFTVEQWSSKTQTVTLSTSIDNSTWTQQATIDVLASTNNADYTIAAGNLPEGTVKARLSFSNSSNQIGIKNVIIEYVDYVSSAVEAPVISATEEEFGPKTVTLTCATDGAAIYYTTDDSTPTDASQEYTAAFEVDASCTVRAIAIKNGESSLVTASLVTVNPILRDFSTFSSLENDAKVKTGCPLTVIHQNGNNIQVTDGTNFMLIYNKNGKTVDTMVNGDIIAAGLTGTKTTYYELVEFIPTMDITKSGTGTAVEPTPMKLKDITAADIHRYVALDDVNITNGKATDADFTSGMTVTAKFIALPSASYYRFNAFVGCYNTGLQLYPTFYDVATAVEGVNNDATNVVASNGAINILGDAATIEVYTAGGALVSKNEATVNCAAGLYIVKVDGKATKVVVK